MTRPEQALNARSCLFMCFVTFINQGFLLKKENNNNKELILIIDLSRSKNHSGYFNLHNNPTSRYDYTLYFTDKEI